MAKSLVEAARSDPSPTHGDHYGRQTEFESVPRDIESLLNYISNEQPVSIATAYSPTKLCQSWPPITDF